MEETLTSQTLSLRMAGRAEIDTSAPFESVKEAVDRFGGSALWRSQLKALFHPEKHHTTEEVDIMIVEEQTAQLEKDLFVKERETLDVLKELEMTKRIVDDLKLKLQEEAAKIPVINSDIAKVHPILQTEGHSPSNHENQVDLVGPRVGEKQSPSMILAKLQQAKVNLNRTTSDLAGIRSSIEILNGKIEKEKALLEKTHEKLASNTSMVSSLEEELNLTILKLQQTQNPETKSCGRDPSDISSDIQKLSSETEQFKKMADASRSEVSKLSAEIEQMKASPKTTEIRLLAARKMEEAARAAEAVAIAEIKVLTNSDSSITELQSPSAVTLSVEEYTELKRKAQEADEISRNKIEAAMIEVEEATLAKQDLLMKVEKTTAEVHTSRKALEEALIRVESANRAKLAVEEALRKWRSDGQKRRYVHGSPRFKTSHPSLYKRDPKMLDVNGLSLVTEVPRNGLRPTLSIGQILSRKLVGPEEYDIGIKEKVNAKPKISLGQMLSKRQGVLSPQENTVVGSARKQFPAKRKKFSFVGISLLNKQNKKNKLNKKRSLEPKVVGYCL